MSRKADARRRLVVDVLLVLGATCFTVALFVAGLVLLRDAPRYERLQTEGVTVSATIVSRSREMRSCGRGPCYDYVLNLLYFERAAQESEVLKLAPDLAITLPKTRLGESRSARLAVPRSVYERTAPGESVDVVYLPERPERVWRATRVRAWSVWRGGGWFSAVMMLAAAVAGVGYVWVSRRA